MINTLKHLTYVLKTTQGEIEFIINHIDSFYYQKEEVKLDDKGSIKFKNGVAQKRVLNPSTGRLKILQKRILKEILDKLILPEYVFGSQKGKSNISNARRHMGRKYIFTTDISNFFPSINHRKVYDMFICYRFSPTVSRLLTQLTTFKGRLPQGAPTSSAIANLVFAKTGDKVYEFAIKHNLTFTSYLDDLTFSSTYDFKSLTQEILRIITEGGFVISHKKTYYRTRFPIVTGIIVKNNSLDLPNYYTKILDKKESLSDREIGIIRYIQRVRRGC